MPTFAFALKSFMGCSVFLSLCFVCVTQGPLFLDQANPNAIYCLRFLVRRRLSRKSFFPISPFSRGSPLQGKCDPTPHPPPGISLTVALLAQAVPPTLVAPPGPATAIFPIFLPRLERPIPYVWKFVPRCHVFIRVLALSGN